MHCVSTSSMQTLWSAGFTDEFLPMRGVRQGDPVSPYIFVLAMEKLGHTIKLVVSNQQWKPINLGRGGPSLSHLFFADDLVSFREASLENAETMSTSHKINFPGNVLGFQKVEDLGTYLGVPLFHKRATKSTFQFVIDKVKRKLNCFDVKLLSLAG
ncbi:hypothetical protein J1N35_012396 [Gossypium stocksii]|uniref:Reverse transcriptase domain-containing protein n=1 Tax=Gossypium stocksii TaxID=47602 RepID=A0A9D4AEE0_9ROSI|nr:hypothetical protein J1N35_012396 [Gossypium stocksii]